MRRKGFTLIELMVVLTIIVVIATASVPKIQSWTARNRGAAAVSQIISDFSKAKAIAAYSVNVNTQTLVNGSYDRTRPETAIMFKKSSYSILQRTDATAWNIVSPLKQTALPHNVTITNINGGSTSDTGDSPTLIFTSTGRVKKTNDALVLFGAGSANQVCGAVTSPLEGRRIFNAILTSQIDSVHFLYYRIEIDTAGEFFVCMEPADSTTPNFAGATANILEL
ncbi:MAG TPA: prepilin-type N-terminal cleavage/methylation domain-containing protein [bacterium]|mgnify:CR=1 FL=1|nr:prepilin-type N-terminal cleavage/methylation domain-containing protein [bacterium]